MTEWALARSLPCPYFCANFTDQLPDAFPVQPREVRSTARASPGEVPDLHAAELAAAYYGERRGGDLHDFVRVTPNRVIFGLLDMAGRLEDNSTVVSAAQQTFRTRSLELFADDDVNEADAMAELCLELNRAIMTAEGGIRSCPAFAGCYNEDLGPSATSMPATLPGCFGT